MPEIARSCGQALDRLLKFWEEKEIDLETVAILGGDRRASQQDAERIEEARKRLGQRFFSDLLFALTNQYYPYEEAESIWQEILDHKYHLGLHLRRNVGLPVAALDYLTNIRARLTQARIIPASHLDEIAEVAVRDGLTRLFGRTMLEALLEKEIQRFLRYGTPLSLVVIDIDDFKRINDLHGHPRGDMVLVRVGELISRTVRAIDTAGRYGGEEFFIVLPHLQLEEASEFAERLRVGIEMECWGDVPVTISAGVASCPEHARDAASLIAVADRAMYKAKRQGKNRVAVLWREEGQVDPGSPN